ncbi:glycerate kinase, partial [Streptomyces sp. NPDC000963]
MTDGAATVARVLVAADKFKGSLTAVEVAERVTTGLRRIVPDLEVEMLPVADGGDGTVAAAVGGTGRGAVQGLRHRRPGGPERPPARDRGRPGG